MTLLLNNSLKLGLWIILMILPLFGMAQNQDEEFKHHHITFGMGHAHIPSGAQPGDGRNFALVPSFGFGYEYWFTPKFALGWKNDFEVADYIIEDNDGRVLTRQNPFSTGIVGVYSPVKSLEIFLGPGIELEENENLWVIMAGLSYEIEIGDGWDITPEFFYELKGGHTSAYAFGLLFGKRL